MKKLKLFLSLLVLVTFSISNAWADDTNTPTSGSQYRLKAVKTGTGAGTYYMVAPTSSGLGGATTTEADGTVFTFTQESSKWYVTFTNNSTTYYMYEHKDNGKVNISTTKTEVAIGTNGDYVKIGSSKWIQFNYNSGNPRVGAYSSSQTGVVLSEVAASSDPTVTLTPQEGGLDWGDEILKGSTPGTKTFSIAGSNLTGALNLSLDAGATGGYTWEVTSGSLTPTSKAVSATVTVTPVTTATGTFDGNIKVNGGGLGTDTALVPVAMTVVGPEASASVSSLSWGSKKQYAESEEHTNYLPLTFTVSGTRLTGNVNISITQDQLGDHFSRYPVSLSPTDGVIDEATVTVYGSTIADGTWTGKVTLSSATSDFADIDIPLSLTVTPTYEVAVAIAVLDKEDNPVAAEDIPDGISATISGGVSGSSTSQYTDGDETLTVTATTIAGYDFTGWTVSSEDLEVASASALTSEATADAAGTITAHFKESATPTLLASKSALDFGEVDINSEPEGLTFTLTGANLTADVSLLTGNENEAFTLSKTSLTKEEVMAEGGVTITVTPKPTYAGTITNKIYANWEGGEQKIVDLSMTVNKLAAGLAWSAAEATVTIDADDNVFPTLSNEHSLAIAYSANNDAVATINAETGAIELVGPGDVTIKAATEGNDTYAAQEVSYTLHVQKEYTVEWWINGVKKVEQKGLPGEELLEIPDATLPKNGAIYGKVFKGWAEAAIDGEVAADAAGIVATPTVMPATDKKYYAVYALETKGTASWDETAFASLATNDVVVVTMEKEGTVYALNDNNGGSSNPPTAVTVTIADNKLSATPAASLQWDVEKTHADTIVFYVHGDKTKWLYTTKNNNGVRVGTGDAKKWTIKNDYLYTPLTGDDRYMGVYNNQDWRAYTSINSNITGQTLAFYKYTAGTSTYSKYATSGPKLLNDPSFILAEGTYTEAKSIAIEAGEGETIYYTINGEDPTTSSDEYTTAISLSKYGEYTIKAIAAKEDGSKSNVASATYKIDVPFASVAELLAYVESKTPFGTISVTGIVSEIVTAYSTQHSNITFNISDDGQTTSDQFQSFRGKGTDAALIGVGDKVTITGTYTVYQGTKELAQDNVISDRIAAAVTSVVISGDASTTEYFYNDDFSFAGLSAKAIYNTGYEKVVTANVEWAADPAKITASGDVNVTATYDDVTSDAKVVAVTKKLRTITDEQLAWSDETGKAYTVGPAYTLPTLTNTLGLAVTYSSSDPTVATISNEEDHEGEISPLKTGTTTIKASFAGNDEYAAKEVSYTLSAYAPTSVVITGDASKKEYFFNETFSFAGLGAKATYSDATDYVIPADQITWTPAEAPAITANATIEVTATWQGLTSAVKEIAVTKVLRELSLDEFAWSDYTAEVILLGHSAIPAVRSIVNTYELPVTYRSGDADKMEVNATTGEITSFKASGAVAMFVEFAGNEEYAEVSRSYIIDIFGLDHVELSGEATKTAYEAGETFDHTGLVATAVYTLALEDPQNLDVTALATWTTDPATIAANTTKVTATATWKDKSADKEVDVTVNTHAVTLAAVENGSVVLTIKGEVEPLVLPANLAKGTIVAVAATPAADYKLTALTAGGVDIKDNPQFTVGTEAIEVAATFEEKAEPVFGWSAAEASYLFYDDITKGDLPEFSNEGELVISFESTNEDVATVSAEGNVSPKAVTGTTTIKAIFAGNDTYKAKTASYTLNVTYVPLVKLAADFTDWGINARTLIPNEDYSEASVKLNLDANTWPQFKMVVDTEWRGLPKNGDNYYLFHRDWTSAAVTGAGENIQLKADFEGEYTFTWTYATNTLTITFPEIPAANYYIAGNFTNWETDKVLMTENEGALEATIKITATDDQSFKVLRVQGPYSTWYGLASYSKMTSSDCENWVIGGGEANIGLEPTKAGDYKFVFVPEGLKLTVIMPAKSGSALDDTEAETKAVKFIRDNQIFILRGDKVYTVDGQLVK